MAGTPRGQRVRAPCERAVEGELNEWSRQNTVYAQLCPAPSKLGIADLYRRAGESQTAERLEREAQELRERFNRDFWLENQGIYSLALQADKQPYAVVSSNPGHALWSGIADADALRALAEEKYEASLLRDYVMGIGYQ